MKKKIIRMLSGLLCLAMLLSYVPVMPRQAAAAESGIEAQAAAETNYISLPITIRDFAADGMLFEYNERLDQSDTIVSSHMNGITARDYHYFNKPSSYKAASQSDKDGFWRYTVNGTVMEYLSFDLSNLKNSAGKAMTRNDCDFAVLRFRTNSQQTTQQGGNADPVVVQRDTSNKANKLGPHADGYFEAPLRDLNDYKADNTVTWRNYYDQGDGWQYIFIKLKDSETGLGAGVTHITIYPKLISGSFDFGGIWFFASADKAQLFLNNGCKAGGITYVTGDTLGFGLLKTEPSDIWPEALDATTKQNADISDTAVINNGTWNSSTQP